MGSTNVSSPYVATKCRCIGTCNDGLDESICALDGRAKCYKALRLVDGEYLEEAGCLESIDHQIDQCVVAAKSQFQHIQKMGCCWDKDMCNEEIDLLGQLKDEESPHDNTTLTIIPVVIVTIVAILVALALVFLLLRRRKTHMNEPKIFDDCSSGSGLRQLVQTTIARQIEQIMEIGRGRYGTVMLGKWCNKNVAVKLFQSTDVESWQRETYMYQTVPLRHENILCFIASDVNGTGSLTELYLITDYHPNGSLHDYLQTRDLDVPSALKLAHSACCGLTYLHTEIFGSQHKSSMAHCDIKSKNILVKADCSCCIADFGLAVVYTSSLKAGGGDLDKGHYKAGKQGTIRYMSPELLNGNFNDCTFDSFKASDVYSFALVMWEILNCTSVQGYNATGNYQVPYYENVCSDPDIHEMRKAVDVDGIRPKVLSQHSKHQTLAKYAIMMSESWLPQAQSRLTMLRICKTLDTLRQTLDTLRHDSRTITE